MTQEEKELLIKDLCARLPYDVICNRGGYIEKLEGLHPDRMYSIYTTDENKLNVCHYIEEVKPYLRPMSSMTEEERNSVENWNWNIGTKDNENALSYFDWLNKKGFDYRGLIPMGLALEAKEGMYES